MVPLTSTCGPRAGQMFSDLHDLKSQAQQLTWLWMFTGRHPGAPPLVSTRKHEPHCQQPL